MSDRLAAQAPGRSGVRTRRWGSSRTGPRDWWVLLLVALVFVPATVFAWRVWHTDWLVLQARLNMVKWGTGKAPMEVRDWVASRNRVQQALAESPTNPMLHDLMASLHLLRARQSLRGSAYEASLYRQALSYQRASLALRPGHGWAWAGLAESLLALDASSQEGWQAWHKALQFAPHEVLVKSALYHAAKRAGPQAPANVRQWMHDIEHDTSPRLRHTLGLPPLIAPKQ